MGQKIIKDLFHDQKKLIQAFFENVDLNQTENFVQEILQCKGALFFSGVGKSGLIAQKIAATFSSIGIKSFFLSPADTLHGDIGRVETEDLVIFLSKSGFTGELIELVPFFKNRGVKILSLLCSKNSPLKNLSNFSMYLPVEKELCPFNLAPTISSTIQLLFGDLLAMACIHKKQVTKEMFALNHPAGSIGKKLLIRVEDVMKIEEEIPLCKATDPLIKVLPILSEKRCGAVLIVDEYKQLRGIFTDGDLRRALQKDQNRALDQKVLSYASKNPTFVSPDTLGIEALNIMEKNPEKRIMVLPVLKDFIVVGILHMHDLLQHGLKS